MQGSVHDTGILKNLEMMYQQGGLLVISLRSVILYEVVTIQQEFAKGCQVPCCYCSYAAKVNAPATFTL